MSERRRHASGPAALVPTDAFEDPRLGRTELRVLGLVCSYAARRTRRAWMGAETLAERLHLSPRSVQRACAKLYDLDYLDRYIIPLDGGGYRFGYVVQHDPALDGATETVGLSPMYARERQSRDGGATRTGRENDSNSVAITEGTEVEQKAKALAPSASNSEPRGTCPECGVRDSGTCGYCNIPVTPDPEPLEAFAEAIATDEEVASRG